MAKSYIVEGAGVRCNRGGKLTRLQLPQDHGMYFMNKPILNERDCVAGVNVMPFGTCQILGTCKPLLSFQWEETQRDAKIGPCSGLIMDSFLGCYWGGCITIKDDGQNSTAGTNGNIDWDEIIAASNGANPIGNPADDNSLSAMAYRSFWKNDDGVPQLSNNVPAVLSIAGAAGDAKIAYTKQTSQEELFGKSRETNEWSNRSRKVRLEEMDSRMNDLGASEKLSKIGKWANRATYGTTIVMDVYTNVNKNDKGEYEFCANKDATNKFASELSTDLALAWGTIELCAAAGSIGGPIGTAAGVVVGIGAAWLLDGIDIKGKTPRAYLQGYAKQGLENMEESWNKPSQDGTPNIRTFR
ncbi:hypothetical protein Ga0466249_004547 [Sporomusaceae bacterium BoRhaA]|uniref:DUF4280 domain-containing protein n=1 Tax=Pelorhabdus rhamnosifermentans TaxID=2772457 RepID=UPI001C05F87B|nr:DUF4280 domain-containing protein [Pelorhabdus rhamnosifermentans]MBU2703402.1 hypothetical protein [Pelorhabdus rhamnosifermentans]